MLKNKNAFLILLCALLYVSCNQNDAAKNESENSESCAPLNPNGDSERALMMRKMTVLAEANAKALRNGEDLTAYNGEFSDLANTNGTMPVDSAFFKGMSAMYIQALNDLYAAPAEDRIRLHNNMVMSCQNCHAQTCRGPLKRIDKLIVNK